MAGGTQDCWRHQSLGHRPGTGSPPEPPGGSLHLWVTLPATRAVGKGVHVVLGPPSLGNPWWQPPGDERGRRAGAHTDLGGFRSHGRSMTDSCPVSSFSGQWGTAP